jgi:hypothetical protein
MREIGAKAIFRRFVVEGRRRRCRVQKPDRAHIQVVGMSIVGVSTANAELVVCNENGGGCKGDWMEVTNIRTKIRYDAAMSSLVSRDRGLTITVGMPGSESVGSSALHDESATCLLSGWSEASISGRCLNVGVKV